MLPPAILTDRSRWGELDIPAFVERNSKQRRRDEVFACARALRGRYRRVAAVGFCFGGTFVFQLGARGLGLVDCIATAHPTYLTEAEIDAVAVPVQILAPERDHTFTPALKEYCNRVIPTLGVPYDYQHFPGVEHSFATRGNPADPAERRAMARAKDAAVAWFRLWL